MSVKGTLIIVGIVALGVLITFGVEEIRFRFMSRALVTEVKALQEKNQELQAENNDLSEEIKTLKAELQEKKQECEGKISQLQEEVKRDKTAHQNVEALRAEVRSLQRKNEDLEAINRNLAEQIEKLKAELDTKIIIRREE